jgi:hypothetical protein
MKSISLLQVFDSRDARLRLRNNHVEIFDLFLDIFHHNILQGFHGVVRSIVDMVDTLDRVPTRLASLPALLGNIKHGL